MQLQGKLSISKVIGGGEPSVIRITIEDEASGISFVEATVSLADFADAVTGSSHQPCTLEVRGLDRVGWQHEHKREHVFIPAGFLTEDAKLLAIARAAVQPLEVDGWKASSYDLETIRNTHYVVERTKEGFVREISFHRYLPPAEATES